MTVISHAYIVQYLPTLLHFPGNSFTNLSKFAVFRRKVILTSKVYY